MGAQRGLEVLARMLPFAAAASTPDQPSGRAATPRLRDAVRRSPGAGTPVTTRALVNGRTGALGSAVAAPATVTLTPDSLPADSPVAGTA